MTPISEIVRLLGLRRLSSDEIAEIVALVELHARQSADNPPTIRRQSADSAAERRRAYDRERQREIRRLRKEALLLTSLTVSDSQIATKEESKKEQRPVKKRGAVKIPIPPDWKPPDRARAVAAELGLTVEAIEPRFRDYLAAHGVQYADYDSAFCNFIRNTPRFTGAGNGKRSDNPRATNESAVLAGLARGFGFRDGELAGTTDEEIPRGRHELDLKPTRRS